MKKSKANSEYYTWGNGCSGWNLVKSDHLSVIEELMPGNTREKRHYHRRAQQFFRILKGTAIFEVEDKIIEVEEGSGIHIPPNTKHRIRNDRIEHLEFLVISQPPTLLDRYEDEDLAL